MLKKTLLIIAVLLAAGAFAFAHEFFGPGPKGKPRELFEAHLIGAQKDIIVVPLGGTAKLKVKDPGTCPANLTASLTAAGIATISPDPAAPAVEHIYTLSGVALGNTTLNVHVTGVGAGCPENTDNFFKVVVVDQKSAEKAIKAAAKKAKAKIKKELKEVSVNFASNCTTVANDLKANSINSLTAFNSLNNFHQIALDNVNSVLISNINTQLVPELNQVLLANGYDQPGLPPPPGFLNSSNSEFGLVILDGVASATSTQNALNGTLQKTTSSLEASNIFISNGTNPCTCDEVDFQSPTGFTFSDNPFGLAAQALIITKKNAYYDANFGVRVITVKGKADQASGATVDITIKGPPDASGNPTYTLTTTANVGNDGKYEAVFQDSAIIAGNASINVTHGTESVADSVAVP